MFYFWLTTISSHDARWRKTKVFIIIKNVKKKCILNWPLPIGAFQDQYKQTMINKYSNEHNYVKNPNWQEVTSWLFTLYKRSREVELGATENNIS